MIAGKKSHFIYFIAATIIDDYNCQKKSLKVTCSFEQH